MQPDGGEKGLLSNLRWGKKNLCGHCCCVMSEWTCRVIHTGMQNTLPCVRRQDVMGSVRLTGWSNNRQTDAHAALPWKKGKILFYLQSKQQGESCRRGVCSCTNRFLYEFPSHPIISPRMRKSSSSSFRTVQACYSLWRQCRVPFDYAPLRSIAPSPQGARHAFTPERGTEHEGWLLCLLMRQEQTELQRSVLLSAAGVCAFNWGLSHLSTERRALFKSYHPRSQVSASVAISYKTVAVHSDSDNLFSLNWTGNTSY